jgi:hypothetical protein
MDGANVLAAALAAQGVKYMFGMPGLPGHAFILYVGVSLSHGQVL